MTLNNSQIEMMQEDMCAELVNLLMKKRMLSITEALRLLYNSHIFEALKRPETGLYFQSPGYVYSYLCDEYGW